MSRFTSVAAGAFRRSGFVAAAVIALAAPASAATLNLVGGTLHLVGGTLLPDGSTAITAADKRADRTVGLHLGQKAYVTFTLLSGDSSAWNKLAENTLGWTDIFRSDKSPAGATSQPVMMDAGLLPFTLQARGMPLNYSNHNHWVSRGDIAVAFSKIFNGGKSVVIGFDNGLGGPDRTFDDLVARIDIAAIPLPAAGWLLLGGLGVAAAAVRRRRPATA